MEALIIISNIPSLIEANLKQSDRIRKIQQLIEVVLKNRIIDGNLNQVVLLVEGLRIAASFKENKLDEKELAPSVPSIGEHLASMVGVFRPFVYLLLMILRGRESKLAFFVCLLMELFADIKHFETFLLRFPVFDKILMRVLPRFLQSTLKSYQSYISYII